MDSVRELIRQKLDELGLDKSDVSRRMGRNHAYLQQYLERGVPMRLKEEDRESLAQLLGVEADDLRDSQAAERKRSANVVPKNGTRPHRPEGVRVTEYDVTASAGPGAEPPELRDGFTPVIAEWSMPADMVRGYVGKDARLAIVTVQGQSMEPEFAAGDKVIVDLNQTTPSPSGVFVVWDGLGLVLKEVDVVIGSTPLRLRLSSLNSRFPTYEQTFDEAKIAGRVIGKWVWR